MPDEVKERTPPLGYKKRYIPGFLPPLVIPVLESESQIIRLINRPFEEIDSILGNFVSSGIEAKIKEKGKAAVLDLGSGTDSVACRDIGEKYGEKVRVVGLDFYPEIPCDESAAVVQGEITKAPLKTESFDVIFAFQALHYLGRKNIPNILDEINRLLMPGGIAVLDWDSTINIGGSIRHENQDYVKRTGLRWENTWFQPKTPEGLMRFADHVVHILFKPPIDEEFLAKFNEVKSTQNKIE